MKIIYKDELGTVAQECTNIYFGMGFNGDMVHIAVDDDTEICITASQILEILEG